MEWLLNLAKNKTIWFLISILIILSTLLLSDNKDLVGFGNGGFSEKQNRKTKGEHFFLNFLLTLLTISCFGLILVWFFGQTN